MPKRAHPGEKQASLNVAPCQSQMFALLFTPRLQRAAWYETQNARNPLN
jgi:hypothetical protein